MISALARLRASTTSKWIYKHILSLESKNRKILVKRQARTLPRSSLKAALPALVETSVRPPRCLRDLFTFSLVFNEA